jgi:large subunit ribosomal protein L21
MDPMYAIVKTGGKQYKVQEGKNIVVEKLDGDEDATVELTEVLFVSGEEGGRFGTPTVEGAKVIAKIVEQFRGKKINGFTFKPKKNIRHRYGHRQSQTRLRIESIVA